MAQSGNHGKRLWQSACESSVHRAQTENLIWSSRIGIFSSVLQVRGNDHREIKSLAQLHMAFQVVFNTTLSKYIVVCCLFETGCHY